jgi:hypothetical protein
MRVGILYYPSNAAEKVEKIGKAFAKGVESMGHDITVINGDLDSSTKLTMYEYVAVIAKPVTLFAGKISDKVGQFLQNGGTLSGKRSSAVIVKSGFGSERALTRLMRAMEREGMFVNYSEILSLPEDAAGSVKRLPIVRF